MSETTPLPDAAPARRRFVLAIRAAVVLLVVSAEVYLVIVLGPDLAPANHYSYFTILSNLFAAAVAALGLRKPVPDVVRGAAVVYIATTGVVYAALLRGVDVATPAYANWAMHVIVPLLVVLDWVLAPPRRRLGIRAVLAWLLFPVAYLAYTLLRGPVVGWYPYPFLDPREAGYGAVAIACLGVAAGIAAIAGLVALSSRRVTAHTPEAHLVP